MKKLNNDYSNIAIGSYYYGTVIKEIMRVEGAKKALFKMIYDVETHYKEQYDNFMSKNVRKFNILIEEVVINIDSVDKDIHYARNRLNKAFNTLDELMMYNSVQLSKNRWILLEPIRSAYHMNGIDGEYNLKFISPSGHFEAVYNKDGVLLTEDIDTVNMSTYNYFSPDKTFKHYKYDVAPYYRWLNIPSSIEKAYMENLAEINANATANIAKFECNYKAIENYNKILEKCKTVS